MSALYDVEAADKRRLWEHILTVVHGTADLSREEDPKKVETETFFSAIEMAFASCDKMTGIVPVHRQLVQYLAGWGRDTARDNQIMGGNPLDPANHFTRRAFDGFIQTLRHAIQINRIRRLDQRILFGALEIPQWIVDKYMDETSEEADHLNQMWEDFPDSRERFSTF